MATFRDLLSRTKAEIREVDTAAADALIGRPGTVVLDVREPDEYDQGAVPGAVHIPRGHLESQVEARVPDRNGAGIRQEGADLIIRRCRFHDNEDGVLLGGGPDSETVIEDSEFSANGNGDGRSHNIYIGAVRRFVLVGSSVHHARIGHNVKSRARESVIAYNRIVDEADGTSSYAIDLPNGGLAYVIGNVMQKGPRADHRRMVAYGAEGIRHPVNALYMVNNTLANDYGSFGVFVAVWPARVGLITPFRRR